MKKFLIILLILCFASWSFAGQGMGPGPGAKGYSGGGCTTDNDTAIFDLTAAAVNDSKTFWNGNPMALQFTTSAAKIITTYKIVITNVADGPGTIELFLLTDDAGAPGDVISGTSATSGSISGAGTYELILSTAYDNLAAGTYWLGMTGNTGSYTVNSYYPAGADYQGWQVTTDDIYYRVGVWGCTK